MTNQLLLVVALLASCLSSAQSFSSTSDAAHHHEEPIARRCFETVGELLDAMEQYLRLQVPAAGPGLTRQRAQIAQTYGWPIGNWCVGQITDFSYLFEDLPTFNEDISRWDVSRATTLEGMFRDATIFNGDLSQWDISGVTNLSFMFAGAPNFAGDGIAGWKVDSVRNFDYMFYRDFRLSVNPLETWNVVGATSMKAMLQDSCGVLDELEEDYYYSWDNVMNGFADRVDTSDVFAVTKTEDGTAYYCEDPVVRYSDPVGASASKSAALKYDVMAFSSINPGARRYLAYHEKANHSQNEKEGSVTELDGEGCGQHGAVGIMC